MEKEKRNLSGIYFRHQNKDTGVWENRVFEDLSISDQEELLNTAYEIKSRVSFNSRRARKLTRCG